jgi:lactate dehydrogenase-like 2-hydroxyacid dehydrogenase
MKRPAIVFLDAETLGDVQGFFELIQLGNLTVYQSTPADQKMERIRGKEIIITNKVIIDKEVMDNNPSMKLICVAATGMNNIDLEYAAQKGIIVRNVAGYSTESVVQHTFSMLFYLMGNLRYYDDYVKNGDYSAGNMFTHHGKPFQELSGKKYGIIGMGTIGKRVAEVAKAFGAEVLYYSTTQKNMDTGYTHLALNKLLAISDVVSIHCPLNEATANMIGTEQLHLMKRNAILINAGRGGIINEQALVQALNEGTIAGAALDVLTKEPPDSSDPLLHIKDSGRLLITPHIAWASSESRERLLAGIIGNIKKYLEVTNTN